MAKRGRKKKEKSGNFYVAIISGTISTPTEVALKKIGAEKFTAIEIQHRNRDIWYQNWGDDKDQKDTAYFMGYETDYPREMEQIAIKMRDKAESTTNVHVYDLVNKKLFYKGPGDPWSIYDKKYTQKTLLYGEKINIDNLIAWGVL